MRIEKHPLTLLKLQMDSSPSEERREHGVRKFMKERKARKAASQKALDPQASTHCTKWVYLIFSQISKQPWGLMIFINSKIIRGAVLFEILHSRCEIHTQLPKIRGAVLFEILDSMCEIHT